ncbi:hypothetical protein PAXINDRAFT_153498 [Paxillus involutus ATCC 200175]|nr:hypothetical protein PAXINDRAFT_153498 [Paxillus involutus ATCC 200175]
MATSERTAITVTIAHGGDVLEAVNPTKVAGQGYQMGTGTHFTAATILEKFQNKAATQAVERVLKKLATERAHTILTTQEPRLPSQTFISAYFKFAAFRKRPHPTLPETPSQGDQTLFLALEALDAADYAHALTLINDALDKGVSWDVGRAEALNLRGTFEFLTADVSGAKADLLESLT